MHFLLPQPVWSSFSTFNSKRLPACIFELFYAFENCVLVQLTKKKRKLLIGMVVRKSF